MTHRHGAYDAAGAKVLELVRPRKIVKSSVEVYGGAGELGGGEVREDEHGAMSTSRARRGPRGARSGARAQAAAATWAISADTRPPCQAIGEAPASSTTSRAPGIAAA